MASKTIHVALNSLDHLPPPVYANAILYLPLKVNVSAKEAFEFLREGLHRTFVQLPWLSGKVHRISTTGTGALEMRHHPVNLDGPRPYQLKFNELDSLDTYEDLRETAFHPSTYEDEALTWAPFLADLTNGAEVFVAQANFMPGACILTAAICHVISDATGLNGIFKIWADNCHDMQLGNPLHWDQFAEISDHSLLEQVWTKEGAGRAAQEFPPETWRLLGLEAPSDSRSLVDEEVKQKTEHASASDSAALRGDMKACIFYMSPKNTKALRNECNKSSDTADVSMNDAICALAWRCFLRSRAAASSTNGVNGTDTTDADGAQVRLDLPFDVRPYFPHMVPPNYLGNFTMIHQFLLSRSRLLSRASLGEVARMFRQAASEITTYRVMDAYTLVKTVTNALELQNLKVDGNGLMITSLLGLELSEVCFGDGVFGNGGKPEAMRTLMGAINKSFRYCAILPRKSHGGVELVANLFDDELDVLLEDEEFGHYAVFVA
ncbi:hypothetical protein F4819DRAFT_478522 [Hypoxylon fuscum]|nr:hypothetical protein F4819DRAFT_478522 [Hypoxylon fuscum]